MRLYLGLDLHCKSTTYVAQDAGGQVLAKGTVPTTREQLLDLLRRLGAPRGTKIALESGASSRWVARLLAAAGMRPVVLKADEVRAKARRRGQKSDLRDAFELCDGIRRGIYSSEVFVPGAGVQRLRRVLSRRRFFVAERTRQVNAAKFLLRSDGHAACGISLARERGWQALLGRPDLAGLRPHLQMHHRLWRAAGAAVEALEAELREALEPFAEVERLLRGVPGVGPVVAATFIAALGNPERFAHSGKVASYAGLVPAGYDSGGRQRRGHITKAGPAHLRAALCEAAHHAARATHPLNAYWRRLCSRGGYRKAVVAVAHRLCRILYQMWKRGRGFDPAALNVELVEQARRSRLVYRVAPTA